MQEEMTNLENVRELRCCECGLHYAVTRDYRELLSEIEKHFFCPNGHKQYFSKDPNENKELLRQKIKDLEKELKDAKEECRMMECELMKFRQEKANK